MYLLIKISVFSCAYKNNLKLSSNF